jgi:hypothetical protein
MASKLSPRELLKKLVHDNPQASEDELSEVFLELAQRDEDLGRAIDKEVWDELGPEGVAALLRPNEQTH